MHPLIADFINGIDPSPPSGWMEDFHLQASCRSYSAHKESPAEAGQGLSWKENQDEETGTDTQIAAVLRLGSQGREPTR
jgi:hypothetical protein